MNKLQIFEYTNKQIRTQIDENGNPWFCAKDICDVLELVNSRKACSELEPEDVTNSYTLNQSGNSNTN